MKNKLSFAGGLLNVILAGIIFAYSIFMILCVILSIAVIFISPIVGIIVMAFFGICTTVSLVACIANLASGIGSMISSYSGKKLNKAFTITSLVVDCLFILADLLWVAYIIYALVYNAAEPEPLDPIMFIFTVLVILAPVIAAVNVIINACALKADKQQQKVLF